MLNKTPTYLGGAIAEPVDDVANKASDVHLDEARDARRDVLHEAERVAQRVHGAEDAQLLVLQLPLEVDQHLVHEVGLRAQHVLAFEGTCAGEKEGERDTSESDYLMV